MIQSGSNAVNRKKSVVKLVIRVLDFLYGYDGKLEAYFEANLTSFTYLFFAETLQVLLNTTKLPDLSFLVVLLGFVIFTFASIFTLKSIPYTKYGVIAQLLTIALYFLLFLSTLIFPFKK